MKCFRSSMIFFKFNELQLICVYSLGNIFQRKLHGLLGIASLNKDDEHPSSRHDWYDPMTAVGAGAVHPTGE